MVLVLILASLNTALALDQLRMHVEVSTRIIIGDVAKRGHLLSVQDARCVALEVRLDVAQIDEMRRAVLVHQLELTILE